MREKLENRRFGETIEFEHIASEGAAVSYIGTVGRFLDGRISEIFLNAKKLDTYADINARDAAVAVSLALQFGCPSDVLRKAMARKPDGSAMGPIGNLLDIADGEA